MGKASQAKKAARLARESGQVEQRPKRRLAFPLTIAAAVIIGIVMVVIARQPASTPNLTIDPTTVTLDPNSITADTSATTIPAGGTDAVPTTLAAGQ
ncbi:MAG: hypothetical protein F2947_00955 [Actinobacteria bacterium]|jgi:hypothetical protein|uniref:Unannotated protein n=1 Tax=freshwater metagenome TaxID=449393 RepID=A0A6J7V495_9ZZZZ|nr:hypothetical protein [Actinomycetota bacterium]MSW31333.1 hypothetical protein [Actinomycetota bacterium]MSX33720.1 hypothetical protein [Actinomycetota bacterium]MSY24528.1 hypothetical protein [Actinomycetota bacterium]MSZ51424.1 hypothetical protein [Actinomycetota bacterium]